MEGNRQILQPITESDEALAELAEGMSPLLLAVCSVHMSGKLDVIRSGPKPKPPTYLSDTSGSLSDDEARLLRAQAVQAMRAYRDAGSPAPYRPTDAELHEMAKFLSGLDLPAEYMPLIREDMSLDTPDPRAFVWNRPVGEAEKARYPVVVIGAGVSGMVMGLRLKQAGIPFVILEKNADVGGTWFENRYPGLRVDVPSQSYSFSFMHEHRWDHLYSPQRDLIAYFRKCLQSFGIIEHIRFGVEVTGADWDDDAHEWRVSARGADGRAETLSARALVSANGFFNRPFEPDFPGKDSFKGQAFHSARWPEGLDLTGKRVAIIGNAATALQMIPPVAEIASHLTVFQRKPSWTFINPEYDRAMRPAEHWGMDHLPLYASWMRSLMFNWAADLNPAVMMVDPQWPQDGRSTSALNEGARQRATDAYRHHLADRPDLLEKLLPDYPPYVKRPTISHGNFFAAMKRDNVELIAEKIDRFEEKGIVDATGHLHEFDVVVFATGFQVQKFLTPMVIRGRGGGELNQFWQDEPGGYLGITVPHFPNFFMMYGPGTNLGYNGNLIFNAELQTRYITHCLRWMVESGRETLEVREEAFRAYMARTGEELNKFVWSTPFGTSYFRNEKGRVTTNSPWSLLDMWTWTKEPDPAAFVDGEAALPHAAENA